MRPTRHEIARYAMRHGNDDKPFRCRISSGAWLAKAASATGSRIERIRVGDMYANAITYMGVQFVCETTPVGGFAW